MPTVTVAAAIARHLAAGPGDRSFTVSGSTVRETLESLWHLVPALRGYVLDDQGALRHHVAAFVDNVVVRDKRPLAVAGGGFATGRCRRGHRETHRAGAGTAARHARIGGVGA